VRLPKHTHPTVHNPTDQPHKQVDGSRESDRPTHAAAVAVASPAALVI